MVAINEAQLLSAAFSTSSRGLAGHELHVIVAQLDVTFLGHPLEPLPSLIVVPEHVDKLTAVARSTGATTIFHARVTPAGSPT